MNLPASPRSRTRVRVASATAVGVLALATLTGCTGNGSDSHDSGQGRRPHSTAPSATPAKIALPSPRSAPAPAASLSPAATPGEVRISDGPFTDRVRITKLALAKGPAAVTGHLAVTSDVSHLIDLELRAAYYDAQGRLLGTGTFEHAENDEAAHDHSEHSGPQAENAGIDFTIPANGLKGSPTAAVVTIPVLVNE
ncbi:hypothetical protein [Streptomyces colonosanans]|uniref:Uncharacterized protein n=1 Tax=Streptomyces colonosanans TaxID=1428652 RepID=A0A1S2P9W1_9ACTN|nr:hypothetical protein [Streptomyces colonosanans]OIJ90417.1 hypothetical protein BIV24_17855 [Streptomyces colonosanans]